MKCPECLSPARVTKWKPFSGMDPTIRQYLCTNQACKYSFFAHPIHIALSEKGTQLSYFK
ncbi:unnamed protein product [marine sediment metagenome]|uniref:Zinc finger Ogr/Delta-type domain-containing protein n=1 Tax=marine sediment metagenome TaxID=412755 RepID=X1SX31_9ZZZZ